MYRNLFLSLVGIVVCSFPLLGKELILTKELHFNTVTHQKEVVGIVRGFDTKLYKLKVKENQILEVDLESKTVHFNIYAPNKSIEDGAMFIGKSQGNHFKGMLTQDGMCMIRVYLSDDEAEKENKTIFNMHVVLE